MGVTHVGKRPTLRPRLTRGIHWLPRMVRAVPAVGGQVTATEVSLEPDRDNAPRVRPRWAIVVIALAVVAVVAAAVVTLRHDDAAHGPLTVSGDVPYYLARPGR